MILISNVFAQGQEYVRRLNWIPVIDGEGLLSNTFSGGINNFEFQFIDIDADNDFDIVFLDSDKTFGWYENKGSSTSAEYELSFAQVSGLSVSDWFYFVDIDIDSDFDFFTANIDRISFFENTGTPVAPNFILVQDTVFSNDGQPIFSEAGSNPVFADIDADGDFDFFTGNSIGTVTFYENIGTPENFSLKYITDRWQNLSIVGGRNSDQLHGASSLEFIDIDADNDLDLFWGDFFSNSLYVIENQGTPVTADMQLISNVYPVSPDSVNTSGFNMPRFIDIDNDVDYDLFVSVLFDPTVPQTLLFYLNEGTNQVANHQKVTNNYLKPLDVKSNSHPAFTDIDNDGDEDMILGSLNNPIGNLHLLKNTGSLTNPSFLYVDSAYFGISGDLSVVPALADLDGDNDPDLLVGLFDGTVDFYLNTGTPESPDFVLQGKLNDNLGTTIDVGISAAPFLFDVDYDNDPDLSIGGFNGRFRFYKNTGNQFAFEFTNNDLYFDSLDVGDNSTPFLIDYNSDGVTDLFSGNRIGKFFYFENHGTNDIPDWIEVTDQFIDANFGNILVPYFIDIDNDTYKDLFIGNIKGGLYLYENTSVMNFTDEIEELPTSFRITAYPNPFNPEVSINILSKSKNNLSIDIFNTLGEKVRSLFCGELDQGSHSFHWNGTNDFNEPLTTGIYIILTNSAIRSETVKVMLMK